MGVQCIVFSNTDSHPVAEIVHDAHGPGYHFNEEGVTTQWMWQEMVAQMDEWSMQMVLQGLPSDADLQENWADAGGGHIVSCKIQRYDKYDVKRQAAAKVTAANATAVAAKAKAAAAKAKAPAVAASNPNNSRCVVGDTGAYVFGTWDFVLECGDGRHVYLHPNWANTKIQCFVVDAVARLPEVDHELPVTGPGGSDGPGTYKYFKHKHVEAILKFNHLNQPMAKAKAKSTAKAKAHATAAARAPSTAVAEQPVEMGSYVVIEEYASSAAASSSVEPRAQPSRRIQPHRTP